MEKTAWTSKMIWVNSITLVAGVIGFIAGHELIADNTALVSLLIAAQGAVNVVLRFLTYLPLK